MIARMNLLRDSTAVARTLARLLGVLAAALVALAPAACAVVDTVGVEEDRRGTAVTIGRSQSGNYLAGRHAQVGRDISTAADFLSTVLERDSENADLLRRTFVLMTASGRVEEAVVLARRVIAVSERAPIAHLTLVVDDIKKGRFAEAAEHLRTMPKSGINRFMVPLIRAWALVGLERPDDALEALQSLSGDKGSQGLYDLQTALINDLDGRADEAEKSYLAVAENQAGPTLRLVELLGGLYERAGETAKARALYDKYVGDNPRTQMLAPAYGRLDAGTRPPLEVGSAADGAAEGLFGVASSLRQQNARETALVFGRLALYLRPDFAIMQILMADIMESSDQLQSANAIYRTINPASPFAWAAQLRVAANLDRLDRPSEAETQLRAMAKAQPALAEPLINLGDMLRGRDRFTDAVEAYDAAVARIDGLGRRHWRLLYARGIALERSKRWQRAEKDFLKALEFEPEQPYVLNYLGYSWVEKGRNLEKARAMIKKAVSLRPNDGFIVDSLGWALYKAGKYVESVRELERAVELRPQDPIINDHLGDGYWKVGRRAEARFQWRRALSLDPDADLIATIRAKLARGLADALETLRDG